MLWLGPHISENGGQAWRNEPLPIKPTAPLLLKPTVELIMQNPPILTIEQKLMISPSFLKHSASHLRMSWIIIYLISSGMINSYAKGCQVVLIQLSEISAIGFQAPNHIFFQWGSYQDSKAAIKKGCGWHMHAKYVVCKTRASRLQEEGCWDH